MLRNFCVAPVKSPFSPPQGEVITSIVNKEEDNHISIYPNPFNNGLKVKIVVEQQTDFSAKLYSIAGELVKTIYENGKLKKGKNSFNVWTGNLNSGVYFLKIVTEQGTSNIRILKQ